jgi:hypothetical protein
MPMVRNFGTFALFLIGYGPKCEFVKEYHVNVQKMILASHNQIHKSLYLILTKCVLWLSGIVDFPLLYTIREYEFAVAESRKFRSEQRKVFSSQLVGDLQNPSQSLLRADVQLW